MGLSWIVVTALVLLIATVITRAARSRRPIQRQYVGTGTRGRKPATIEGILTDVDVVLKQVDITGLGEFETSVVHAVFGGRLVNQEEADVVKKYMRKQTGYDIPHIPAPEDTYTLRRWSGDQTLPSARYYSLARDSSGNDGGTLIAELYAYHNLQTSGIVIPYDTTDSHARDHLKQSGVPEFDNPRVVLDLCRTPRKPSPLSALLGIPQEAFSLGIPLTIERRRLKSIVDLRNPATASRLAEKLDRLAFGDPPLWVYPNLRKPASFGDLIPSLMVQNLGGSSFLGFLALWLRHNGARGVIYPSARVDTEVEVENGRVVSSSGFNFVSYEGAPVPELAGGIHVSDKLLEHISNVGLNLPEPLAIPGTTVRYSRSGSRSGSWSVAGVQFHNVIDWRIRSIEYMLREIDPKTVDARIAALVPWITWAVTPTDALNTSHMVFHALLDVAPYPSVLSGAVAALTKSTDDRDRERLSALKNILLVTEP
jgi:hypothetical protein